MVPAFLQQEDEDPELAMLMDGIYEKLIEKQKTIAHLKKELKEKDRVIEDLQNDNDMQCRLLAKYEDIFMHYVNSMKEVKPALFMEHDAGKGEEH